MSKSSSLVTGNDSKPSSNGLRSPRHQRNRRCGHIYFDVSHSFDRRQHGLPERHSHIRSPTKKTTLSGGVVRLCLCLRRRRLGSCRTTVKNASDAEPRCHLMRRFFRRNVNNALPRRRSNFCPLSPSQPVSDDEDVHVHVPGPAGASRSTSPGRAITDALRAAKVFLGHSSAAPASDHPGTSLSGCVVHLPSSSAMGVSSDEDGAPDSLSPTTAITQQPLRVHSTIEYVNVLVPNMVDIAGAAYYWGEMDRYRAEELLEESPEGTFLLRDSAQINYLFSVSFRRYRRTLHARIERSNGMFSFDSLDDSVFKAENITKLVANYKDPSRCLFFEPQLSIPLPRNFVFDLKYLCRAVITTHTTYEGISDLPLPTSLKKYLREYHFKQAVRITDHEV